MSAFLCFDHKEPTTCSSLGYEFECIHSYDHDSPMTEGIILGHYATGLTLFVIGILCLYNPFLTGKKGKRIGQFTTYMPITIAAYSFITSAFALIRANWDTGRPLLVGAAIHNLFEWGMMAQMLSVFSEAGQNFGKAFLFIWIIISATLMAPSLAIATVIEQTFGVSLDYFILFTFFSFRAACQAAGTTAADKRNVAFFSRGFHASILHFGQIWTLIVGTIFPNIPTVSMIVEFLVFVTSGACFYTYMLWSYEFEAIYTEHIDAIKGKKKDQILSSPFLPRGTISIKDFLMRWLPALAVGAFTILGPPLLLPACTPAPASA